MPQNEPFPVMLIGGDRRWHVEYPSLGVSPADSMALSDIHVPANRRVVFVLKSTDFLYTFEIPQQKLKEIAAPGLEFRLTLGPSPPGRLGFVGEPMCGDPHTAMAGDIILEPSDRFFAWLKSRGEPRPADTVSRTALNDN